MRTVLFPLRKCKKLIFFLLRKYLIKIRKDPSVPALFLKFPLRILGLINPEAIESGFGNFYDFFKETAENRTKDTTSKELFKLVFRHFHEKSKNVQGILDYLNSFIHPNVSKIFSWSEKGKQVIDDKELPILNENGAPFSSMFNPLPEDLLRCAVMHKKIVFHNQINSAHPSKVILELDNFKNLDEDKQKEFLKLFANHLLQAGFDFNKNKIDYYVTLLGMIASITQMSPWSKIMNLGENILTVLKTSLSGSNVEPELTEIRDQLLILKKIVDENLGLEATPEMHYQKEQRIHAQTDVILRLASIPFYPLLIPLAVNSYRIDDILFKRTFSGFFQNPFFTKVLPSTENGGICCSLYIQGKDKFSAKAKQTMGIYSTDKSRLLATVRMNMHFEFVNNQWKGSFDLKKPSVTKNATHEEICLIMQEFAAHQK